MTWSKYHKCALIFTLVTGLWGCGPPGSVNLPGLFLILPGILSGPACNELLGPCPPPEPGALLNNANISRSIWFEDERIGAPDDNRLTRSLCEADLDKRPGDEFVFRGDDGFTVLAAEAGFPAMVAFIPAEPFWKLEFLDVNGDGDTEFLFMSQGELGLRDHAGDLLWRRTYRHTAGIPFSNISVSWGSWENADIDGDGVEEFAITPFQGVDIIEADGSAFGSLEPGSVNTIKFGDVTGDGMLEIVTRNLEGTIAIWANDGTELNSFVPSEHSSSRIRIIRLLDSDRDQILLHCAVYDIDGSIVARLEEDERILERCPVEEVEHGRPPIESPSCTVEVIFIDEPIVHEVPVRFVVDREPFLVHLSYSINSEPPLLAGYFSYQATRTILRIFNPEGTLVYHEVLESASTPGSFAVIPSDVEDQEILLLADDTRILAYELDPDGGE